MSRTSSYLRRSRLRTLTSRSSSNSRDGASQAELRGEHSMPSILQPSRARHRRIDGHLARSHRNRTHPVRYRCAKILSNLSGEKHMPTARRFMRKIGAAGHFSSSSGIHYAVRVAITSHCSLRLLSECNARKISKYVALPAASFFTARGSRAIFPTKIKRAAASFDPSPTHSEEAHTFFRQFWKRAQCRHSLYILPCGCCSLG